MLKSEVFVTKMELKNRIVRVQGLRLTDPWGDVAFVRGLDPSGDSVWLIYDGVSVPFERSLDDMVNAANDIFLADKSDQFTKRETMPDGMTMALHYEPFWVSDWVEPKTSPAAFWAGQKRKR